MERYRFLPPIAEATVALLKRKGDASVQKPEDIAGKVVGAGKASAQLAQLKAFADTLPQDAAARICRQQRSLCRPGGRRIVAVGNSLPTSPSWRRSARHLRGREAAFGTKSYFGYIGRKDADYAGLDDAVQAAMLKIKADGRLAKIQKKWFGDSFDTPDLITEPAL